MLSYARGPDLPMLEEDIHATFRLKAGITASEVEFRDYCRGKIAHYKIPEYIRLVDEFPMTVTGKIQKFRIREQEIELRGLSKISGNETA